MVFTGQTPLLSHDNIIYNSRIRRLICAWEYEGWIRECTQRWLWVRSVTTYTQYRRPRDSIMKHVPPLRQ